MILAAGRGKRMRPLTDKTPKPLLFAGGKPLLQYHLERLAKAGFSDVVINHAHLGCQIEDYFGDHACGIDIQYSVEGESSALETGGGIFKALSLLIGDEQEGEIDAPFLVINGDIWTDFAYETLLGIDTLKAHLVMVGNPGHNLGGDFFLQKKSKERLQKVLASGEESEARKLTFSGISLLRPSLFNESSVSKFPLAPLLKAAIKEGAVTGESYTGAWFDIGTPERLQALDAYLGTH